MKAYANHNLKPMNQGAMEKLDVLTFWINGNKSGILVANLKYSFQENW